MRSLSASAPSKLILLGEHAVVYGHPALAVALRHPQAQATVSEAGRDAAVCVELKDFSLRWNSGHGAPTAVTRSFARILEMSGRRFKAVPERGWTLSVSSDIPLGCGLGSGAAVSCAAFQAIFGYFNVPCTPQVLSDMVYEVEKLHHGTPSGIDNTVISMGRPVLFRKGEAMRFLSVPKAPFFLVIGYTGKAHKTSEIVAEVAKAKAADPAKYDAIFKEIGELSSRGAEAFQKGLFRELGKLMCRNQELLEELGVSSLELENLVRAAMEAGAFGAKLSGAGRGGCMAALVESADSAARVRSALESSGAAMSIVTEILHHENA